MSYKILLCLSIFVCSVQATVETRSMRKRESNVENANGALSQEIKRHSPENIQDALEGIVEEKALPIQQREKINVLTLLQKNQKLDGIKLAKEDFDTSLKSIETKQWLMKITIGGKYPAGQPASLEEFFARWLLHNAIIQKHGDEDNIVLLARYCKVQDLEDLYLEADINSCTGIKRILKNFLP